MSLNKNQWSSFSPLRKLFFQHFICILQLKLHIFCISGLENLKYLGIAELNDCCPFYFMYSTKEGIISTISARDEIMSSSLFEWVLAARSLFKL